MLYVNIASPLARAILCTADELGIDYETTVRISEYQIKQFLILVIAPRLHETRAQV